MYNFLADLETARRAAQAGAHAISLRFGMPQDIQIKHESNTLVTGTDKAAEATILDVLKSSSAYSILSEESGLTGTNHGPVWIVDPLDGTSNFARSLPFFAVSLALVDAGKVLIGVIIDPVHNQEYYALKDGGAFCNNKPIKIEKQINSRPTLFLNHGSKLNARLRYADLTARLSTGYDVRKLGTTALELCFVAAGYYDGFICSGDEIWDFAAGVLIASEAGYTFTDWNGHQWDGKGNHILVCRPDLHKELVKITSLL
jgi:myo-inositol-1(or 4)-monophosphatase